MGSSGHHICGSIGRLSLTMLVVLVLLPACANAQASAESSETTVIPYVDADAYSIYAILLQSEKHAFFVINPETSSSPGVTPGSIGIKGDHDFYKAWGPALKDYAKQFRTARLLIRNIPTEVPYEFLPEAKFRAIFKSKKGWDAFYELYPSSGGYYWFSAVGFDPQKTHAIVQINHFCGMLCGNGEPHFFRKNNGKWREVSVNATVGVWAS